MRFTRYAEVMTVVSVKAGSMIIRSRSTSHSTLLSILKKSNYLFMCAYFSKGSLCFHTKPIFKKALVLDLLPPNYIILSNYSWAMQIFWSLLKQFVINKGETLYCTPNYYTKIKACPHHHPSLAITCKILSLLLW